MDRIRRRSCLGAGSALLATTLPFPRPARAAAPAKPIRIASGLEHPWSLAFLPDGSMLVTERPGRLRRVFPDGLLYLLTESPDGQLLRLEPRG